MTKKVFLSLFLLVSVILFAVPVSAEASGGTEISTVVPNKYTVTFEVDGSGSIEYENVLYKNGDTIQVTEGSDLTFVLYADSQFKLKSVSYNGQNVTKQVSDNVITIKNVQQDGTFCVTYAKSSIISPATGDNSNFMLWTILAFGSVAILSGIGLQTRKSKHR